MADFYIRSWDPDSTYPPNPQEGDVCYTITLDQSWAPVAGVKNDNLLKEEVYTNGEWVEQGGGGGGGGGDFTTATVTIVNNSGGSGMICIPWLLIDEEMSGIVAEYSVEEDAVLQVPLYKGNAFCDPFTLSYTLSGDAEVFGSMIQITGDCTITFVEE